MVAATVTAYSLLLAGDSTYFYLCIGLILWGAYTGSLLPHILPRFGSLGPEDRSSEPTPLPSPPHTHKMHLFPC